jgi:hypothetical protein
MTHYLVTDASAAEVEAKTGLSAHQTPFGALVKKPRPFRLDVEIERLNRLLRGPGCGCGSYAIMHRPSCRYWLSCT